MHEKNAFYYDCNCILVINSKGGIRKLHTPFRVYDKQDLDGDRKRWHYVEEVHSDEKERLLYLINGKLYSYFHFEIRIQF